MGVAHPLPDHAAGDGRAIRRNSAQFGALRSDAASSSPQWGAIAMALRRFMPEPEVSGADNQGAPLEHIWKTHRAPFVYTVLLYAGLHTGFWGNVVFPKSFLVQAKIRSNRTGLMVAIIGMLSDCGFKIFGGLLCDRIGGLLAAKGDGGEGRRDPLWGETLLGAWRLLPIFGGLSAVLIWPLWCLMVVPGSNVASLFAAAGFGLLDGMMKPAIVVVGMQIFPAGVAATGVGLSYNLAHCFFSSLCPFIGVAAWEAVRAATAPATPWLANTAPAFWPEVNMLITCVAALQLRRMYVEREKAAAAAAAASSAKRKDGRLC